ncbi:hypothetical protein CIPAW_10G110600 [Carya illinoinensis]|uniref:Uncharacterized protein n=1 Tax=Carya illinoinensis TaxID=32201 RepID=A0A8T1PCY9_CARIL|nr:hypothetical protein CIPAW_10G110600 [Carya illinoinensis]
MVTGGGKTAPEKLKNRVAWRSSWRLTVSRMEVKLGGDVYRWEGKKIGWVVSATSPASDSSGLRKQLATERKGRADAVTFRRAWRLTVAQMAMKIGGSDHRPATTGLGSQRVGYGRKKGSSSAHGEKEGKERKKKKEKEGKEKEKEREKEKENEKEKEKKRGRKKIRSNPHFRNPKTNPPKTISKT